MAFRTGFTSGLAGEICAGRIADRRTLGVEFSGVAGQGLDSVKCGSNRFFAGLGAAEVAIQVDEEIVRGGIGQWVILVLRMVVLLLLRLRMSRPERRLWMIAVGVHKYGHFTAKRFKLG